MQMRSEWVAEGDGGASSTVRMSEWRRGGADVSGLPLQSTLWYQLAIDSDAMCADHPSGVCCHR